LFQLHNYKAIRGCYASAMNTNKTILGAGAIIIILSVIIMLSNRKIPNQVILQVPFTPQAPTDNWARNEDCEETSITMANAFLNNITVNTLPASDAQNGINQLKNWENINIGYNMNTGTEATTKMAQGAFKIKVKAISNFKENDLKQALANNHPILLPINARKLNNPKYLDNGPLYHMIVIRGYNDQGFIVNDPGTNEGNGNIYNFDTLKNAAADWDQKNQTMDETRKIALILSK
jgi:hypothetical protein